MRIQTTAPRLLGLAATANLESGAAFLPFSSGQIAYDDTVWTLTATATLELDTHAGNASSWPASTLSLGGATGAGSIGAQSSLTVKATAAHAVAADIAGNTGALAQAAPAFAVTPPPGYSGTAIVRARVCSQWGECAVCSFSSVVTCICPAHTAEVRAGQSRLALLRHSAFCSTQLAVLCTACWCSQNNEPARQSDMSKLCRSERFHCGWSQAAPAARQASACLKLRCSSSSTAQTIAQRRQQPRQTARRLWSPRQQARWPPSKNRCVSLLCCEF